MCTYMRARKYSIYIKSLKGVSERIRFQDQKSNRKGDTRINNETMDRYGIEKQSMVAMEELAELQKAISKLVRNPKEKTELLEFKCLRNNLIEEMADALICMDQLIEFYKIRHFEIQDIIQAKQKRQAKRLEEE